LGTEARGTLVFTMNIGMMAEKRRVRGGSTKQHPQRGSSPGNLSYVTTARHHPQRRCGSSSRDATAEGRPRPLEGATPPRGCGSPSDVTRGQGSARASPPAPPTIVALSWSGSPRGVPCAFLSHFFVSLFTWDTDVFLSCCGRSTDAAVNKADVLCPLGALPSDKVQLIPSTMPSDKVQRIPSTMSSDKVQLIPSTIRN
jgi:hypothetical protein